MDKLLRDYQTNPTLANALRVKAYNAKHPMAGCMLSVVQGMVLIDAVDHANSGKLGIAQG